MIVDEKWAWFDEQAALKLELMEEELNKLEITKASQIGRLSRMILTLESTLGEKLKASGVSSDQVESQSTDSSQGLPVATLADKTESTAVITDDSAEKTSAPASPSKSTEPEENRGFFFNTESGVLGDLGESLDPTTLAVLGILITLAATAV